MAALRKYHEAGPVAMGVMAQHDNGAQKDAICELIDVVDCETIYLDWEGEDVSKEKAKEYVRGYDR
jgi:hypothetical protein